MNATRREQILGCIRDSTATIASLAARVEDIEAASGALLQALRQGRKVLTVGNGGSAAEALHLAEELTGRYRSNRASLPGISLVADSTALTCISNDYGYDEVFSRQIEGLGSAGDVLVLFSTSGQGRNLARALDAAQGKGLVTIALLGRDGGAVGGRADHEILVEGEATERIQEAHQVVLHLLLDAVEDAWEGRAT